ncbi:MAG: DUF2188 domain-containing protein [Prevotellaceae bacterium]|nr:DUF2188 domain-containing protein [Prevotellaceae bacterium]
MLYKSEGSTRATKNFETQKEAIAFGKLQAQNQHSDFLIHSINGKIRERNIYDNNPFSPRG